MAITGTFLQILLDSLPLLTGIRAVTCNDTRTLWTGGGGGGPKGYIGEFDNCRSGNAWAWALACRFVPLAANFTANEFTTRSTPVDHGGNQ